MRRSDQKEYIIFSLKKVRDMHKWLVLYIAHMKEPESTRRILTEIGNTDAALWYLWGGALQEITRGKEGRGRDWKMHRHVKCSRRSAKKHKQKQSIDCKKN